MKHSEEFKQTAVDTMMNRNGKSVRDVAKDLGIQQNQLYAWRAQLGKSTFPGMPTVKVKKAKAKPATKAAPAEDYGLRPAIWIAERNELKAEITKLRDENADLTKVIVKLVYKGMFG